MNSEELKKILQKRGLCEKRIDEGDLSYINLANINLEGANLKYIDFEGADLSFADLEGANLMFADLQNTNLERANLSCINLTDTNLSFANLKFADLSFADLRWANLTNADLKNIKLNYAVGDKGEVKSMHIEKYDISWDFQNNILNIGCKSHSFDEWKNFTNEQIDKMDTGALKWWKKWKEFIFKAIELSKDGVDE